jgi:hypothetical protein
MDETSLFTDQRVYHCAGLFSKLKLLGKDLDEYSLETVM